MAAAISSSNWLLCYHRRVADGKVYPRRRLAYTSSLTWVPIHRAIERTEREALSLALGWQQQQQWGLSYSVINVCLSYSVCRSNDLCTMLYACMHVQQCVQCL
jgi:hypothetical protein